MSSARLKCIDGLTNCVQAKYHLINFWQSGLVGGDVGLEVVNLFLDHFNLKRGEKNISQGAQGEKFVTLTPKTYIKQHLWLWICDTILSLSLEKIWLFFSKENLQHNLSAKLQIKSLSQEQKKCGTCWKCGFPNILFVLLWKQQLLAGHPWDRETIRHRNLETGISNQPLKPSAQIWASDTPLHLSPRSQIIYSGCGTFKVIREDTGYQQQNVWSVTCSRSSVMTSKSACCFILLSQLLSSVASRTSWWPLQVSPKGETLMLAKKNVRSYRVDKPISLT